MSYIRYGYRLDIDIGIVIGHHRVMYVDWVMDLDGVMDVDGS